MTTSNDELRLRADPGFLLARARDLIIQLSNARLAHLGLRVRQYTLLAIACDAAAVTQREIAEIAGLDPSRIVAIVDELESRGLVERRVNPNDRRTHLISATREGRLLRDQSAAAIAAARDEFFSALDDDERASLLDILQRVVPGARSEATDSKEESS